MYYFIILFFIIIYLFINRKFKESFTQDISNINTNTSIVITNEDKIPQKYVKNKTDEYMNMICFFCFF